MGGVAAIAFAAAAGPQLAGWLAGAAYVDSGRLLPVVVGAYVCFSLGQMQQFVPAAMTQDMKGSARAHGWAALANVLANFILVPRFGLWGAAWSTVTAYALALFLLTRSVHSLLPELGWPRKLGAMAVLLVMATSLALLVRPQATGPASALLWGALTIVVTVGLAASLKLIARQDMKLLAKLRPSTF